MGAPEPLLDVFASLPETTDEPGADATTDGDDNAWLGRIIGLTGSRDFTSLSAPSVDALLTGDAPAIDEVGAAAPSAGSILVAIDRLSLDGLQTRRTLDADATVRLAASITEFGVLEPLLVRPSGDAFQIIAGNRRYQAAALAGLTEVPVVVLDLSDREAMMVALVENLQREDITALDEADCYLRLLEEFGWTQDELARHVGRSRSHIGNTLRLLGLPAGVKTLLRDGCLSAGHARALLNAANADALAAIVVAQSLSVRATETLVRRGQPAAPPKHRPAGDEHSGFEQTLAGRLGLAVRLQATRQGGKLTIHYKSTDELDTALRRYGEASASTTPQSDVEPAPLAALPA